MKINSYLKDSDFTQVDKEYIKDKCYLDINTLEYREASGISTTIILIIEKNEKGYLIKEIDWRLKHLIKPLIKAVKNKQKGQIKQLVSKLYLYLYLGKNTYTEIIENGCVIYKYGMSYYISSTVKKGLTIKEYRIQHDITGYMNKVLDIQKNGMKFTRKITNIIIPRINKIIEKTLKDYDESRSRVSKKGIVAQSN